MLRYPKLRALAALTSCLMCFAASPVHAACTVPTGNEGDQIYNHDYHTMQFCNGTSWIAEGPGGCFAPQTGAYQPTIPSGSGYFVMSKSTFTGSLGGQSGADATCLTELTTNTGWAGYSSANSNGQLDSTHVHAFLCYGSPAFAPCLFNLMPLATYYFADANSAGHGGASFTTDSNGLGPNDSASWSAANYFGGAYTYWVGDRDTGFSSTAWPQSSGGQSSMCSSFTSASSGNFSYKGQSSSTTTDRWDTGGTSGCNNSNNIICVVNPL